MAGGSQNSRGFFKNSTRIWRGYNSATFAQAAGTFRRRATERR